jgi:hypothetical protein
MTPLMIACELLHFDIILLLLAENLCGHAEVNLQNHVRAITFIASSSYHISKIDSCHAKFFLILVVLSEGGNSIDHTGTCKSKSQSA